jgi:hypothetical protein
VIAEAAMSLDGFIADTCDAADQLFDWYNSGDVNSSAPTPTGSPQQPPATYAQRGPTSARSSSAGACST